MPKCQHSACSSGFVCNPSVNIRHAQGFERVSEYEPFKSAAHRCSYATQVSTFGMLKDSSRQPLPRHRRRGVDLERQVPIRLGVPGRLVRGVRPRRAVSAHRGRSLGAGSDLERGYACGQREGRTSAPGRSPAICRTTESILACGHAGRLVDRPQDGKMEGIAIRLALPAVWCTVTSAPAHRARDTCPVV